MKYLVIQQSASGAWEIVWQGDLRSNASYWLHHFSRLNELAAVLISLEIPHGSSRDQLMLVAVESLAIARRDGYTILQNDVAEYDRTGDIGHIRMPSIPGSSG